MGEEKGSHETRTPARSGRDGSLREGEQHASINDMLQLCIAKRWQHVAYSPLTPRLLRRYASTRFKNGEERKRTHTQWTPEDDRKLVELRVSGVKLTDMLSHFPGRGKNAARHRLVAIRSGRSATDHGLVDQLRSISRKPAEPHTITDEELEQVRKLREQGLTMKAIAELLGIHYDRVWQMCHSTAGHKRTSRIPYSAAEDAQLTSLREAGFKWTAIQQQMPQRSEKALHARWQVLSGDRTTQLPDSNSSAQLKRGPISQSEVEEIMRQHAVGRKTRHIAAVLGRDVHQVAQKLWALKRAAGRQADPTSPAEGTTLQAPERRHMSPGVANRGPHNGTATSQRRPQVVGRGTISSVREYSTAAAVSGSRKNSTWKRWTPEEDHALAGFVGRSTVRAVLTELAQKLGRSYDSVYERMRYLKKPGCTTSVAQGTPWGPVQEELLTQLYMSGHPLSKITAELGRSRRAVSLRITKLGLANRRAPRYDYTPTEKAAIVRHHKTGLTWAEIARQTGLDQAKIRTHALSHKLVQPRRSQSVGFDAQARAELHALLRDRCDTETIAKTLGTSSAHVEDAIMYTGHRHKKTEDVRKHATAVYLKEHQSYTWRQIVSEFKLISRNLSRIYVYSSSEIYAGLVEDDPRLWSDEKLQEVANIVRQRVAARNAELGLPRKRLRR